MANRTIRTAKNRKRILDSLAEHGRITRAINAAGISRSAVKAWRDDEPTFDAEIAALVEEADERNTERVEDAMLNSAVEGNVTAQIFWLKNHAPHRYKDRMVNEHTGPDGAPLVIQFAQRPDGPA